MDLALKYQPTPNPNALIFHCPKALTKSGAMEFSRSNSAQAPELVTSLLELDGVESVLLEQSRLTLTKSGTSAWTDLIQEADRRITAALDSHLSLDAPAESNEPTASEDADELAKIELLLDQHIRPFLMNDGGNLQVISLKGAVLKIHYVGACGSCPGAIGGTLMAIQQTLRSHYREDMEVVPV